MLRIIPYDYPCNCLSVSSGVAIYIDAAYQFVDAASLTDRRIVFPCYRLVIDRYRHL